MANLAMNDTRSTRAQMALAGYLGNVQLVLTRGFLDANHFFVDTARADDLLGLAYPWAPPDNALFRSLRLRSATFNSWVSREAIVNIEGVPTSDVLDVGLAARTGSATLALAVAMGPRDALMGPRVWYAPVPAAALARSDFCLTSGSHGLTESYPGSGLGLDALAPLAWPNVSEAMLGRFHARLKAVGFKLRATCRSPAGSSRRRPS